MVEASPSRNLPNRVPFSKITVSHSPNSGTGLLDKISNILHFLSSSLHQDKDLFYDAQELWEELTQRGFSENEIELALVHIERTALELPGVFWSGAVPVHRSYTVEEMAKLPVKVRGYLWRLKCRGIINHALEDEIIQKALNLDTPAGLREIKTVAALTVFGYEHKFRVGGRDLAATAEPARRGSHGIRDQELN